MTDTPTELEIFVKALLWEITYSPIENSDLLVHAIKRAMEETKERRAALAQSEDASRKRGE